ncbi:hypothetical protein [Bosea massiliensis]|uniref:Uncharacterized protein n=1 Tax=Bosea massiliensis TaxID=151419 RepID=A0ABW0PBQ4_9HYPH
MEYADTWRDACDISKVGPDHQRGPITSDIGLLIRDMVEDRPFKLFKLDGDTVEEGGDDEVTLVDVSDANNPRIHTASGAVFVVRIVLES